MNCRKMKKAWLLFHSLGIGCLSMAVYLQILVFWSIYTDGTFFASEPNQLILMIEMFLTAFAAIYLLYIFYERIRAAAHFAKKT